MECTAQDCTLPANRKRAALCEKHYAKRRRYGDENARRIDERREEIRAQNEVLFQKMAQLYAEGFSTTEIGKALGRNPSTVSRLMRSMGAEMRPRRRPMKAGIVGYHTVHMRLHAQRGSASQHLCVSCGGRAKHWAYDHADDLELVDERGSYSMDLNRYQPMCVSCHKLFDLEKINEKAIKS